MTQEYVETKCPTCGHKLMEDFRGQLICPYCLGVKMAKETFAKLKEEEQEKGERISGR